MVPLDAHRKVMQFGGVIWARALMGSRFVNFVPPRTVTFVQKVAILSMELLVDIALRGAKITEHAHLP